MKAQDAPPTRRWINRPEGSNWGDFGYDDQLGSLNYIGHDQRRFAASLVVNGENFCLSLPLDLPGGRVLAPHRGPPCIKSSIRRDVPYFNYSLRVEAPYSSEVGSDDIVTLNTQYSTQWDSFAHIGYEFDADADGIAEPCFYNGYRAHEHILPPELRSGKPSIPLGIGAFAERPIQGRGVLVDLERHLGRESCLVGLKILQQVLTADKITVKQGDILCLHTGYADEILNMGGHPDPQRIGRMCAVLDGSDSRLLNWISDTRISAIAADNHAVEQINSAAQLDCDYILPLHHHCLFKRGIPLGELWYLTEFAKSMCALGRSDFLLTAPPLRLHGAVGSPVTPVAMI